VTEHRFGGDLQFQSPSARVTVERGQERWYPAEPFRVRVVAVSRPPLGWDLMVASFYSHRLVVGVRLASDERIEPGEPLLLVGHGGRMLGSVSGRFVGTDQFGPMLIGARLRGGYSGGLLMRADGAVVGVTVAGTLARPCAVTHLLLGL
jgi:hypothetical protein